jgi:hypothetical protein
MTPRRSRIFSLVAACGLVGGMCGTPSAAFAGGSQIPFTDSDANGTLTFCNPQGQPQTSGSLLTQPFVWKTVASTSAPSGYTKAVLYIYQPIEYVDPGNWTGDIMTAGSFFSNPAHPVVQDTYLDEPLYPVDRSLPPHWDGLYELRMYFDAPDKEEVNTGYPAAVIQVSGNNWTLLSQTTASCNAGTGESDESLILPKSEVGTPVKFSVDNQPAGLGPNHQIVRNSSGRPAVVQPSLAKHTTDTTTSTAAEGQTGPGSKAYALAAPSKPSSGSPWAIGGVVVGLLVVGGAVTEVMRRRGWRLRRRHTSSEG